MDLLKTDGRFSFLKLLASLLLAAGAGVLAGLFTGNAGDIYQTLVLPPFAPPVWVFAPVWAVLYALAGVAFYRVWMSGDEAGGKSARQYFLIQLAFNILWSALFFGFALQTAAAVDIVILLFYLTATAVKFFRADRTAGLLLLPYLAWVLFAAALNIAIILLNI